jgi:IS5 family transposase
MIIEHKALGMVQSALGFQGDVMSQLSFSDVEYGVKRKKTKREIFLAEMDSVVPWDLMIKLIEPMYPKSAVGRPAYGLPSMLRVYCMQQWYGLSDPAMEEALYEIASMRRFAGFSLGSGSIPDETTILKFRHLLETHVLTEKLFALINQHLVSKGLRLSKGTIVDATIIEAPSSTKNATGTRDPEMHQTKKGNNWHFGMKAHIGVDAETGLVHSLQTTSANVHDLTPVEELLTGEESSIFADAGYRGAERRTQSQAAWHIAMRPGKRRVLSDPAKDRITDQLETLKARVRAKVEHPFRVIKIQFGFIKARYKGMAKNRAQLHMLFALANLYMIRRRLMAMG